MPTIGRGRLRDGRDDRSRLLHDGLRGLENRLRSLRDGGDGLRDRGGRLGERAQRPVVTGAVAFVTALPPA